MTCLAVLAGLKFGYDAGVRMAGVWLGIVMAGNAALIGGLLTGAVMDRLLPRSGERPRPEHPA